MRSTCDEPLAYLITFHTYESWLPGDASGSVDAAHNVYGTPLLAPNTRRAAAASKRLRHPAIKLSAAARRAVEVAIRDVAGHRGWEILAVNVRTNHAHAVVCAAAVKPEKVLNDFKTWATRGLRACGVLSENTKPWSRHGSTRYLWTERAVENACRYVVEGQGAPRE